MLRLSASQNVGQVGQHLGLSRYSQTRIQNHAIIIAALTRLIRKDVSVEMGPRTSKLFIILRPS